VLDGAHRVGLAHLDAELRRVAEQDVVELRAQHVKRRRPAAWIVAEEEAPRLGVRAPDERATGLADEPRLLDGRRDAERVEDRQGRGKERLPDVVAREPLLLEEDDAATRLGQKSGGRRPRRTAADDGDITLYHGELTNDSRDVVPTF
jgi:hypothetical protein